MPDRETLSIYNPDSDGEESYRIREYDLVSTPNDFNVLTMKSFLESGSVQIPRYQRNYVWDRARASSLIESLILGLPIPQVFLYEEARNRYQIIDGQQRLMSIYFFMEGRFPRPVVRPLLRQYWEQSGAIPREILQDNKLFEDFTLRFPKSETEPVRHPLDGRKYETLGDARVQLDMRTIRNIIIKESNPEGRGAIYEIFHRLNATGVNLTAQEIRVSLNNSELMDVLVSLNANRVWRRFLGSPSPDNRMRDVEVLLRAIAMRETHDSYSPSMVRFLNGYAEQATKYDHLTVDRLESEAIIFFGALEHFDRSSFLISRRFSVPVFEAVYAAADLSGASANAGLSANSLAELANDPAFIGATTNKTTDTRNVKARIEIARGYVAAG